MSNNDYGIQLKNIGIQLKNIGTQILNDGMFNQTIYQTQIQNMGNHISNMGIQIFNYGTKIINIMNNIMNNININMINMMNQMQINMIQIMENMNNMNNNNKNNNFDDSIVNIMFRYGAKTTNIQICEEATVAEVINKYVESEFEGDKKKIIFLFNGGRINIDDSKNIKIKDYLQNGSTITVINIH